MKKSFGPKTLIYPTPVWVVGTYDAGGRPNIMTVAWGGICCSQPPCVAVSLRKATYSFGNIVERKAFTVNVPSEEQVKAADYVGMVSGRNQDKFAATGLTPIRANSVDAPYVKEFPMILECRLLQTVEIGLHTQFIGEVVDVKVEETALDERGMPEPAGSGGKRARTDKAHLRPRRGKSPGADPECLHLARLGTQPLDARPAREFLQVDGTWIEIHKEGKLAGCGAVVRDNHFQLATGLGLEDDVPGGYFLLLYTALQEAFEHNVRLVRFGTGAYDVKRRLGFHLQDTNHAMITMAGFSSRGTKRKVKPE